MLISRLLIALGAALFLFAPTAAAAPEEGEEPPLWAYALQDKNPYDSGVPLEAPKQPTVVSKPTRGVMERIAWCESRNSPTAANPLSSAKGRFQFLKGSWEYYGKMKWGTLEGRSVYDYDDNTELAYWVYEREGTTPWLASSHCWR